MAAVDMGPAPTKPRPRSLQKPPPPPVPATSSASVAARRRATTSTASQSNIREHSTSFANTNTTTTTIVHHPAPAARERDRDRESVGLGHSFSSSSSSTTRPRPPTRSSSLIVADKDVVPSSATTATPAAARSAKPAAEPAVPKTPIHRRIPSALATPLSLPTKDPLDYPSASASLLSPRLYASATAAPPAGVLSPPRRLSPAHFSSNGVPTSTGPPPSLAYKRKLAMEHRKQNSGTPAPLNSAYGGGRFSNGSVPGHRLTHPPQIGDNRRNTTHLDFTVDEFDDEGDEENGDKDRTIRGLEDLKNAQPPPPPPQQQDADHNEADNDFGDVFLRLANSANPRSERKRDRLAMRNSLPADATSPPMLSDPIQVNSSPPEAPPEVWRQAAEMNTQMQTQTPLRYRARRMSNTADDETNPAVRPGINRNTTVVRRSSPPSGVGHSRSFSVIEPSSLSRSQTSMSGTRPRTLHASPHIEERLGASLLDEDFLPRRGPGSQADRESVSSASTTAQSSVWDELDDLKSRIRRLEITGRMPPSGAGNASITSSDRPRTATTAATTISSSPRTRHEPSAKGPSPVNSTYSAAGGGGVPHPLLHAALAKAKSALPADVYRYLDSAANDALSLAATIGTSGTGTAATAASDRQLRRKVDSMCRSLTELCISLTETQLHDAPKPRATLLPSSFVSPRAPSRDRSASGRESVLTTRESILTDRTRTLARFADRKSSLASLTGTAYNRTHTAADILLSPRTSVGNVRQRAVQLEEAQERAARFRAPSRANTEALSSSRAGSRFTTRDYDRSGFAAEQRRIYASPAAANMSSPTLTPSTSARRFFPSSAMDEPRTPSVYDHHQHRMSIDESFTSGGGLGGSSGLGGGLGRSGSARRQSRNGMLRESVELESRAGAAERLLRR
ncbi:hypothetical protein EX30DRAFT_375177 [Ascodesmis nigricans]|uniref:Uncharacterized protein n=1 Tax=Ascodesmis nigricans TaxID=341454 RepID=A0A4S2MJB5_9PEZI|nr:hypothetical protein EX30DRAFT_375177 [Ascodesmis nigricans]